MFTYYLNGKFVPADQATLPLGDLGIVRGYGVFDALRTYGPFPFKLREHLQRLQFSASQIELEMPWSLGELASIVDATLAENGRPNDVGIRILVTGGESPNLLMPGNKPSLAVMISPFKPYASHFYEQGASLVLVTMERFLPSVKTLNYITSVMVQKRIKAAGAVEILHCDKDGYISECGNSNFLMICGNQLITSNKDVLSGITRNVVMELAEDRYEVVQRLIHVSELAQAEEAFITSSSKEVMPIVRVSEQVIGNGKPGPRTRELAQQFRTYVEQEQRRLA